MAARDDTMPIRPRRWLDSPALRMMLPEQSGAHFWLCCAAWVEEPSPSALPCSVPDDPKALAVLSRLGGRWARLGGPVRALWRPTAADDGSPRLIYPPLSQAW